MRRAVQAAICAAVIGLGLFGMEGWTASPGDAAHETHAATSYYDEKLLSAIPTEFNRAAAANAPIVRDADMAAGKRDDSGIALLSAQAKRVDEGGDSLHVEKELPGETVRESVKTAPVRPAEDEKIVYLTFDDGPSKFTPMVLDILKAEGIKATFFVLGEQVERNPDLAKRIVEEGHAIGNHSYNHRYEDLYSGFNAFAKQVIDADEAIYAATGVRTLLFRAPGGTHTNFDQGYFDAMAKAGYKVHDWNVDSGDSKRRGVPASEIVTTIQGSRLGNKLNVLLHDSAGHEESIKALPAIIDYYKGLGYSFAALTDEAEPIQFHIATKLKWNRGAVSKSQEAVLVKHTENNSIKSDMPQPGGQGQKNTEELAHQQGALEEAGTKSGAEGEAGIKPGAQREAATKSEAENKNSGLAGPDLVIYKDGQRLKLSAGEHQLTKGTIYVPLHALMEWIDGTAAYDDRYGTIELERNGKHVLWSYADGGRPASSDSDTLYVPIRAMLDELGINIPDYTMDSKKREIWLAE